MSTADIRRADALSSGRWPVPGAWLTLLLVLGLALGGLGCGGGDAAPESTSAAQLSGTWTIDKAQSTAIDPWRDLTIDVDASASRLTLERIWRGYYGFDTSDSMTIPIDEAPHTVPMPQWPDNRHIGAFLGGDSTKTVTAQWLDDGRTLQVTTRVPVRTSQGLRSLRTHSEYRVSPDRTHLTVLELRSTRPDPIRYTLERDTTAQEAAS
jgi:hypothetical protein